MNKRVMMIITLSLTIVVGVAVFQGCGKDDGNGAGGITFYGAAR